MHELALAEELVKAVVSEAQRHGVGEVIAVQLRIGELQQVLPEALEAGFRACGQGTVVEKAELRIEFEPAVVKCQDCSAEFRIQVTEPTFVCPKCESVNAKVISGENMLVESFEVADE